jgi:hypothetical protein
MLEFAVRTLSRPVRSSEAMTPAAKMRIASTATPCARQASITPQKSCPVQALGMRLRAALGLSRL